jgi:hypothetical protein
MRSLEKHAATHNRPAAAAAGICGWKSRDSHAATQNRPAGTFDSHADTQNRPAGTFDSHAATHNRPARTFDSTHNRPAGLCGRTSLDSAMQLQPRITDLPAWGTLRANITRQRHAIAATHNRPAAGTLCGRTSLDSHAIAAQTCWDFCR